MWHGTMLLVAGLEGNLIPFDVAKACIRVSNSFHCDFITTNFFFNSTMKATKRCINCGTLLSFFFFSQYNIFFNMHHFRMFH